MAIMTTDCLENWMGRVDQRVQVLCGLSVYDLPDCCYADWYEEGMTAAQAARAAVKNAKGEGEL